MAPARVSELYRAHFDFVWRNLRRLGVDGSELDDAAQEVFLVLLRRFETLPAGLSPRAWLFGVVRRIASRHHRTRARGHRFRAALAHEPTQAGRPPAAAPERMLDRREAAALLDDFLDRLTRAQREVFILAELEQRSGREIAQLLDLNTNTVSSRLRAARRAFDRRFSAIRAEHLRLHDRDGPRRADAALSLSRRAHDPTDADRQRVGAIVAAPAFAARASEVSLLDAPLPGEGAAAIAPGAARRLAVSLGASPATILSLSATAILVALVARSPAADDEPTRPAPRAAPTPIVAAAPEPGDASVRDAPDRDAPDRDVVEPASATRRRGSRRDAAEEVDPLRAELALLEEIRAALVRGAPDRALTLATDHAARFPKGVVAREREGLRITALCQLGRADEARRAALHLGAKLEDPAVTARFLAPCDASKP
ncbi:MAG: sigma-70 family RNA polymerase sigma factor [Myxococcales bacterium]|nr:sigma-70 family RNA polymerase sigma factor [Myxococcales bacterium]